MRNLKFLGMSFLLAMTAATSGVAQNPIIQTKYTADPAPMVYNDTVFLYTTHDEDADFSSAMMVNGRTCNLNLKDLNYLMLAGRTFISRKKIGRASCRERV